MARSYLTEPQAVAIISGGSNEAGTTTRTQVQVYISHGTGAMVYIQDGEGFEGWLASTRKPSAARSFKTLDAAYRAAASLIVQGCPGIAAKPLHEAGITVEVICDRAYLEGAK